VTNASDPKSVAVAYIDSVGQRPDETAALLHEQLDAVSAGRHFGRDEWLAALDRLSHILLRNDVIKTISAGDEVLVVYDFVTDTPVGAVPTAEWLTIEDGQVRSIQLLFERERWPEVLAELEKRMAVGSNS
jgi:hypothetical protein